MTMAWVTHHIYIDMPLKEAWNQLSQLAIKIYFLKTMCISHESPSEGMVPNDTPLDAGPLNSKWAA